MHRMIQKDDTIEERVNNEEKKLQKHRQMPVLLMKHSSSFESLTPSVTGKS